MRFILQLLIFISILGCTGFSKADKFNFLNKKIYKVQKKHLQESPFNSAKGSIVRIKNQQDFRSKRFLNLTGLQRLENGPLTDTLLLIERFNAIAPCSNCRSDYLEVLYQDTIFIVQSDFDYNYTSSKLKNGSTQDNQKHLELLEFQNKIRKGAGWKNKPLSYGADNCMDGDHTMITAIYPNDKIVTIYVRCLDLNYDPNWNKK